MDAEKLHTSSSQSATVVTFYRTSIVDFIVRTTSAQQQQTNKQISYPQMF